MTSYVPQPPANVPQATASVEPRGSWQDFVTFRVFVTPGIMTIIWLLGVVAIGFGAVVTGTNEYGNWAAAAVGFCVAQLIWRVILEVFVVLFSIHTELRAIARK